MANLFSTIKSAIVEAYAVVCLSINPVVEAVEVEAEVSKATTTVANSVAAAKAVSDALAVADAASKCCDTWEGYQEYCAAVQRIFDTEDKMLEAASLVSIPAAGVGDTEEVEVDEEEYDAEAHEAEYYAIAINHPELAAIAKALELEADEAVNKGYKEYSAAVQRFFAARDAVLEADRTSNYEEYQDATQVLADAVDAAKVAELEADEAANHSDTWKGYQKYCAAVQRLFAAEDAVIAAQAAVDIDSAH